MFIWIVGDRGASQLIVPLYLCKVTGYSPCRKYLIVLISSEVNTYIRLIGVHDGCRGVRISKEHRWRALSKKFRCREEVKYFSSLMLLSFLMLCAILGSVCSLCWNIFAEKVCRFRNLLYLCICKRGGTLHSCERSSVSPLSFVVFWGFSFHRPRSSTE